MKKLSILLLTLSMLGCSVSGVNNPDISNTNSPAQQIAVSKQVGAVISGEISLDSADFKTKANANGTLSAVKVDNIKSLKVYLIKSSTPAFTGTDPLNAANIVTGPVDINVLPFLKTIRFSFTGIPSSAGNYYHIAVRAFNTIGGAGTELIQTNNGGATWTGTTAATPQVAIDTGTGITVSPALVVSSVTPLSIVAKLGTDTGANIDTFANIKNVNPANVRSYIVNYCTDPTQPITTAVLTTPLIIDADSTKLSVNRQKLQLTGLPSGTYYATVQPFESTGSNGVNILKANNGGTAYTGTNAGVQVAVSTNSVTISSNLVYSFSSGNFLNVDLNIGNLFTLVSGLGIPSGVAVDSSGNLYIADTGNNVIKKRDTAGVVTTLVSTGLANPFGVALDIIGNLYIADTNNNAIKKRDTAGVVTTLVTGLNFPFGVAVDSSSGNVYIADTFNNAIKKRDTATGVVTDLGVTVLTSPKGVAVDSSGNVYISDSGNNRVLKSDPAGTTVTDLGVTGLLNPFGVAVDSSGNVYIADSDNNRVLKINPAGVVTTLVSTGLANPYGVAVDSIGNVYIADTVNNAIKVYLQ